MFEYEKRLEYPINIKTPNPAMAKFIISQYGGPDCIRVLQMIVDGQVVFFFIINAVIYDGMNDCNF